MKIKRKNINRGFTQLRVWQDAIELFKLSYTLLNGLSYDLSKVKSNILDASHSISRNVSEGYSRKNLKEYLNFLNYSLGSCGELYSSMVSLKEIDKISEDEFESFDKQHYKVENELINLIKSLQKKQKKGNWESSFA